MLSSYFQQLIPTQAILLRLSRLVANPVTPLFVLVGACPPVMADILFTNLTGYRYIASSPPENIPLTQRASAPQEGYWTTFEAFLVAENGRIQAVFDHYNAPSDDQGSPSQLAPAVKIRDLGGRIVLPGLIDAHAHVIPLGQRHQRVDLVGTTSLAEAQERISQFIRQRAEEDTAQEWVLGRGWNQVLWPGQKFPRASDLDEIESKRPTLLNRIDGHAAWANSAALKRAGISALTPDPNGGQILRDRDGSPTGILIDSAMDLIQDVIPAPTASSLAQALDFAQKELSSLGVTTVHDAGIDADVANLYKEHAKQQLLRVRLYAMIGGAEDALEAIGKPWRETYEDFLTIRSVKLYADGALGSRGAALLEPYTDQPEHFGLLFSPFDQLKLEVERAIALGHQVNVHAIGDAANRQVLDIFADLNDTQMLLRHRIEHAQVIALQDIERFAHLGVIASIQPVHATSDMNMAEDRIGGERIKGAYAWRKLLNADVRLAGGSDFPVELANPFHGLYAAITRKDQSGSPKAGWYAKERLTRAEALRLFTYDAAYAGHQEKQLGNIAPGYWADFIVLEDDFFKVPEHEIWQLQVRQTWVAGDCVYEQVDEIP